MSPFFLTLDQVLDIHEDQIQRYGGDLGLRDLGLLESAIAVAEAGFEGTYLHGDIFEMAAAYLFHIVKNPPFVDGNKRTGAATALVFLELNGSEITATSDALVDLVLSVVSGKSDKSTVAGFFRKRAARA